MANNQKNTDNPRVDFTPSGKPTKHGTGATYNRGCRCDECRENHYSRMQKTFERIRKGALPDGDSRHGTSNGYINYSCRCDPCKVAGAKKNKSDAQRRKTGYVRKFIEPDTGEKARVRRLEEFRKGKRKVKHGTLNGYKNYKCRCDKCRKASQEYNKTYYAKKKAEKMKSVIG